MKRISLVFLWMMTCLLGYGQSTLVSEEFALSILPAKKGALLAYNGKAHGFTLAIEADSVQTMDERGFLRVNGQVLQSSIVAIPAHLFEDSLSDKKQHEIILGYIQYELEYFKKELKIKYRDLEMHPVTFQGKPFVLWHFSMPKDSKDVKKQLYFTSVRFNQAHSLNMPMMEGQDLREMIKLMSQVAGTIKQYNHALDIEKLKTQAR